MRLLAIIPARYHSSRFEGKPLAMINSKPMVMWVYDAVKETKLFDEVLVATDEQRIFSIVNEFSGKAIMTSDTLRNGTERCNEVVSLLEKQDKHFDIIINIQGDEPLIKKQMIEAVIDGFEEKDADIVTLKKSITNKNDIFDANVVKVVCAKDKALYFSRSAVPFSRDGKEQELLSEGKYYKHIGIYGYRTSVLKQIVTLQESFLEKTEKLEQLRWLENGYNIIVKTTEFDTIGVDTPQDLENIKRIINKQ